ncbi:hypothetical protein GCM10010123_05720 [Pilimelia anulata]|uniref:Glycosyltransferase n=1 Tax=Pilimelia anulata TaxID=53371 RepID=A0A8J3F7N9_9ACTN|nr:glycosyltransferase [Pilimelia anulata]GGJ78619.1 hypothetical protein GCM10010123_05720 [Pilimelia anulata]
MSGPDVDVVVPVYNTMPYLTRCLRSLVDQTIGRDRMRVIAVDDGSTDGSGRELDRFARRYPGLVTVLHQPNSGGPAGPCNRALDVATGRYVFFVGADDHLGPEALARLVAAADAHGSDVVLGRVVGTNSRTIYQDIFARDAVDVDLFDSPLPRSLANTKLFRRELLERYAIRYPEGLPLASDLPFTLAACYRARRISVLTGYDFYHAVRRLGAGNITYRSRPAARLRAVEATLAFVADLIEPGPRRDAVLAYRFDHEVARLVDDDFLRLDPATRAAVHAGVRRVAAAHLGPRVAARLNAPTRIRLAVAAAGTAADLAAVIDRDARLGVPATVAADGRRYAAYPGFGTLPDACFDVTASPDWPAVLDAVAAEWGTGPRGRELTITAHTPARTGTAAITAGAEDVPADVRVVATDAAGTTLRLCFPAADLLAGGGDRGRRRIVSAQVGPFAPTRALGVASAPGAAGAAALRAPRLRPPRPLLHRSGPRLYAIALVRDPSGRVMLSVVPATPRRLLTRATNHLRR